MLTTLSYVHHCSFKTAYFCKSYHQTILYVTCVVWSCDTASNLKRYRLQLTALATWRLRIVVLVCTQSGGSGLAATWRTVGQRLRIWALCGRWSFSKVSLIRDFRNGLVGIVGIPTPWLLRRLWLSLLLPLVKCTSHLIMSDLIVICSVNFYSEPVAPWGVPPKRVCVSLHFRIYLLIRISTFVFCFVVMWWLCITKCCWGTGRAGHPSFAWLLGVLREACPLLGHVGFRDGPPMLFLPFQLVVSILWLLCAWLDRCMVEEWVSFIVSVLKLSPFPGLLYHSGVPFPKDVLSEDVLFIYLFGFGVGLVSWFLMLCYLFVSLISHFLISFALSFVQ